MERFIKDHPVVHAGFRDAFALALVAPFLVLGHRDHAPGLGCLLEAMQAFVLAVAMVLPLSLSFHAYRLATADPAPVDTDAVNGTETSPAR